MELAELEQMRSLPMEVVLAYAAISLLRNNRADESALKVLERLIFSHSAALDKLRRIDNALHDVEEI